MQSREAARDALKVASITEKINLRLREKAQPNGRGSSGPDQHSQESEIQDELAKILVLLNKIDRIVARKNGKAYRKELDAIALQLESVANALLGGCFDLMRARRIRRDVKRVLNYYGTPPIVGYFLGFAFNRYDDARRSRSRSLQVLYGLCISLMATLSLWTTTSVFLIIVSQQKHNNSEEVKHAKKEINKERKLISETKLRMLLLGQGSLPSKAPHTAATAVGEVYKIKGDSKLALEGHSILLRHRRDNLKELLLRLEQSRGRRILYSVNVLSLVIFAGALGGAISILTRIEDFQEEYVEHKDVYLPVLDGAFRPIVGSAFAIFIFALLSSGIFQIAGLESLNLSRGSSNLATVEEASLEAVQVRRRRFGSSERLFIFAISFVVGFSERIGQSITGKEEATFGTSRSSEEDKN